MKRELLGLLVVAAACGPAERVPMSPSARSRGESACGTDIAGDDCLAFALKLVEDGVAEEQALGVSLFERRCTSGNAQGCFVLGYQYGRGTSLTRDPQKAQAYNLRGLDIEEALCAQGESFPCFVVSSDYHHGENVPHDMKKAWVYANKYCVLIDSDCAAGLSPSAFGLSVEEAARLVPKADE